MKEKLSMLYARYGDVLRYALIGGITTLLDWGIFTLLNVALGVHYQVSNVIAWIVAVAFAFIGNKWIVFRSASRDRRDVLRESISFVSMRLLTLGFTALFLYLTVDLAGWDEPLAKLISNLIVIVLNYVLSKVVVFRKEEK